MSRDLADLRNLGPVSIGWLRQIGVETAAELARRGSIATFLELRMAGLTSHLNMLYALEGALLDVPFHLLPSEIRAALREAAQA